MQTINIKTPVKLTTARLENFFKQLRCGLRIYLDAEALTAALLGEEKVKYAGKIFDLFDFTEAVQCLAKADLGGFIDFLRGNYGTDLAVKIFNNIPGFEVVEDVGNYQVVRKNLCYLVVSNDGRLAMDSSWLSLEDAIAAVEQLAAKTE